MSDNKLKRWLTTKWKSILVNLIVIIVALWGVHLWQTRNLLSASGDVKAPHFNLVTTAGRSFNIDQARGKKVFVYFMAPWCTVCHASVGNFEKVKLANEGNENLLFYIIGLDYKHRGELRDFVKEHNLTTPVLVGDEAAAIDYKLAQYPTYYVVNEEGFISGRAVGYATELGLRARVWM